jgi:hypothetical protein
MPVLEAIKCPCRKSRVARTGFGGPRFFPPSPRKAADLEPQVRATSLSGKIARDLATAKEWAKDPDPEFRAFAEDVVEEVERRLKEQKMIEEERDTSLQYEETDWEKWFLTPFPPFWILRSMECGGWQRHRREMKEPAYPDDCQEIE